MDDAEYGALYDILNGDKTFKDWSKNQENSLRQRVYKKWKSRQYKMKEVHDPMAGNTVQRIVHTNTGSIVIKKSELSSIVHSYFDESKGDGALKLSRTIQHRYSGLLRNFIQKNLNVMKETQKIRPLFQNKAPLRPIKAGQVHERHQVDLVNNMQSMPVTVGGVTYKYIMSVMCGSRKYPYPHHGRYWKFRRGGGVKDPGNSRGKGGCMIDLVSRGLLIQFGFDSRSSCSKILSYLPK